MLIFNKSHWVELVKLGSRASVPMSDLDRAAVQFFGVEHSSNTGAKPDGSPISWLTVLEDAACLYVDRLGAERNNRYYPMWKDLLFCIERLYDLNAPHIKVIVEYLEQVTTRYRVHII